MCVTYMSLLNLGLVEEGLQIELRLILQYCPKLEKKKSEKKIYRKANNEAKGWTLNYLQCQKMKSHELEYNPLSFSQGFKSLKTEELMHLQTSK